MNVLIPIDFSKPALKALSYACNLFRAEDARLMLLHNFIPLQGGFFDDETKVEENRFEEERIRQQLQKLADRMNREFGVAIREHRVLHGGASRNIVAVAKKEAADLIVMGTTGKSGLREKLVGSTTTRVMAQAPCPVLAVPERYRPAPVRNIIFCTEFSLQDLQVLRLLRTWQATRKAKLHLYHFVTAGSRNRRFEVLHNDYQKLLTLVLGHGRIQVEVKNTRNVQVELEKLAHHKEADLMVMLNRRRKWWQHLTEASHTRKVVYQARIPILAYPVST